MQRGICLLISCFILLQEISSQTFCSEGCDSCASFTSCYQCSPGYGYNPSTGNCRPCPEGCSNCTVFGNNQMTCLSCFSGYSSGNGTCFQCSYHCDTCLGHAQNCSSCFFGEVLTLTFDPFYGAITTCEANSSCVVNHCGRCSMEFYDKCDQCVDGYFLFQGQCKMCNSTCLECYFPQEQLFQEESENMILQLKEFMMNSSYNYSGNARLLQGGWNNSNWNSSYYNWNGSYYNWDSSYYNWNGSYYNWNSSYYNWNSSYYNWNSSYYPPWNNSYYPPWNNSYYPPWNNSYPWWMNNTWNSSYYPPWNNSYPWWMKNNTWNDSYYPPWNNSYPWWMNNNTWNSSYYPPWMNNSTWNSSYYPPWNNSYPWWMNNTWNSSYYPPWNNSYYPPWNNSYPWWMNNNTWNDSYYPSWNNSYPWWMNNTWNSSYYPPWNNSYPWWMNNNTWNDSYYPPWNNSYYPPWNNSYPWWMNNTWNSSYYPPWMNNNTWNNSYYPPWIPPPLSFKLMQYDSMNVTEQDKKDINFAYLLYKLIHFRSQFMDEALMAETIQKAISALRDFRYDIDFMRYQSISDLLLSWYIDLPPDELKAEILNISKIFSKCEECTRGLKVNNATSECIRCDYGCVSCDSTQCFECEYGMSLSMNQYCVSCMYPCAECLNYNQSTCTSCYPPYLLNNFGECVECQYPCDTCAYQNSSYCFECLGPNSKYANSVGQCYLCSSSLCEICDEVNPSFCYQCVNGLTTNNGTCDFCQNNCEDCDNFGGVSTCYKCREGYALMNNICEPCGRGCKTCAQYNNSICEVCHDGLFVNSSGICNKCPDNCITCDKDQNCIDFQPGKIEFDGMIIDCREGCQDCDLTYPDVCVQCEDRYFLEGGICMKCMQGCQECSGYDNCTSCNFNFVLISGNCTPCNQSCLECQPFNVNECTLCKKGLSLVNGNCVHECQDGCFQCDPFNATKCEICEEGFALIPSTRECMRCLGSCSGECSPENITHCLNCTEGFQLQDNNCVRCPLGCSTCSNGECYSCVPNYKIDYDGTGKMICSEQCRKPCTTCNSDGVCSACGAGFKVQNGKCVFDDCNPNCNWCPPSTFRDNSTGECVLCQDNCSSCNQVSCFECISGSYLNSTGQCTPCVYPCEICADQNTCTKAADGYLLQVVSESGSTKVYSSFCTPCDSKCKTCVDEPSMCTSCYDDAKLNGTTCMSRMTVGFMIVVNYDYMLFIGSSEAYNFMMIIVMILQINYMDIVLNSITEGSTQVQGSISSTNANSANQNSQTLSQQLGSNLPYEVVSSDIDVYYDDQRYAEDNNGNDGEDNSDVLPSDLGVVIGAAVGGVVVIAVVVGIVIWRIKKKKAEAVTNLEDSEINMDHHDHKSEGTHNNQLVKTQYMQIQENKVMYS